MEVGAGLQKRRAEGASVSALDAAMRVIDGTTAMARHLRAGPLPPAKGFERLALTGAAAQLRIVANAMGFSNARTAEAPSAEERVEPRGDPGFVSPGERSLQRDEKEARMRAALGALIAETLALVDDMLATPAELDGGPGQAGRARVLPPK